MAAEKQGRIGKWFYEVIVRIYTEDKIPPDVVGENVKESLTESDYKEEEIQIVSVERDKFI